jgi:hypothetical protein
MGPTKWYATILAAINKLPPIKMYLLQHTFCNSQSRFFAIKTPVMAGKGPSTETIKGAAAAITQHVSPTPHQFIKPSTTTTYLALILQTN